MNEKVNDLITIIEDTIFTYEDNNETIKYCQHVEQDLLHKIEFTEKTSASEGYRLFKQLRDNRINRREKKDENAVLKPLYDYLNQDKEILDMLKRVQKHTKKVKDSLPKRQYTPRVLTTMEQAFQKAKSGTE